MPELPALPLPVLAAACLLELLDCDVSDCTEVRTCSPYTHADTAATAADIMTGCDTSARVHGRSGLVGLPAAASSKLSVVLLAAGLATEHKDMQTSRAVAPNRASTSCCAASLCWQSASAWRAGELYGRHGRLSCRDEQRPHRCRISRRPWPERNQRAREGHQGYCCWL